jgi:eukaryotic-like serine/threonine-protein kinase
MNAERWQQIVALFERGLEVPVEQRDRFLESAISNDVALRERVGAMLRADAAATSLFGDTCDQPDESATSRPSALEGRTIGSYTVVREIGHGGMATVYLAYDIKHRRSVALKLLSSDTTSAVRSERFRREIGVLAQLQHPNILPLFDSGRVVDDGDDRGETNGRLFYAMPLVEGESLRQRIARDGQLPISEVRRIAWDVAAALDYAHRRGVVHRDVKPANILLGEENAFLADFGVAHLLDEAAAAAITTGGVIGTLAYMSPEQVSGEQDLDARTDVYALGCVIFEMLTGEAPFGAAPVAIMIAQHQRSSAPSARVLRPDLPDSVDDILQRALAKNRADRFASARELAEALDAAVTPLDAGGASRRGPLDLSAPPGRGHWRRGLLGAGAVVVVLLLTLIGWRLRPRVGDAPSIAILPITNMSNDPSNEYFVQGLTEELIGELAQLKIRVVPRTTAYAYKGRYGDIRRIGRELGVSRVLEASARRDADRVLIRASLFDSKTGERVWTDQYERSWSSMLTLQTQLAAAIIEQLEVNLLPGDRKRLAGRHTANTDAYENYLRGRHFFDVRTAASLELARGYFQRALEIDTTYGRAYAGLADTYSILAWTGSAAPKRTFALAEQAAERALSLDSTLAESQLSLGIIRTFYDWKWDAADRFILRALALDSTLTAAWYWRTWPLVAAGRHDEALASLQRARQLDPLSPITNTRIGTLLAWSRRYGEADSVLRKTLQDNPEYPVARVQLARVLSMTGRHAEAMKALPPDSIRLGSYEAGIAGFVYARAGQRTAALAAARGLERRDVVPAEGVAAIYAALGDKDRAIAWLEKAVALRGVGLIFLGVEPMYDGLRGDRRFTDVLNQIGVVY